MHDAAAWPDLPYQAWRDTAQTLQLWTQIAGKIRLSQSPWVNHGWHLTLYVSARGLTTSPIPTATGTFELEFDFVSQRLAARSSRGDEASFPLEAQTVAAFHDRIMALLHGLGVAATINAVPNELPNPIPFGEDSAHATYDPAAAHRFWRVLVHADTIFKQFRSGFLGKVSPVHFFWGSFDLAVTRFSGRRAPLHPGGVAGLPDAVVREAYSHEVSSAGFWPGNDAFPQAAFYSYAYPEPPGFRDAQMPQGAYYEPKMGEFILPYDAACAAADPAALVTDFLGATYNAAATAAQWNRAELDCAPGVPGEVRPLS